MKYLKQFAGDWHFWTPLKTWEELQVLEAMGTSGYIDMCLESQFLERRDELAEIGKQVKSVMQDNVFEGMPLLVKALAGCTTGDALSINEGEKKRVK